MDIEKLAIVARAIVTVIHEPKLDDEGWITFQDQILLIRRDPQSSALSIQLKAKGQQLQEVLFVRTDGSIDTFQSGRTAIFQNWINYLDDLLKQAVERAAALSIVHWRTETDSLGFAAYVEQVSTILQIAIKYGIRECEPESGA